MISPFSGQLNVLFQVTTGLAPIRAAVGWLDADRRELWNMVTQTQITEHAVVMWRYTKAAHKRRY